MTKIFLILLFIFLIILYLLKDVIFMSYVTHYPIENGNQDYFYNPYSKKVYYSPMGNWFELGFKLLPDVVIGPDLKTMKPRGLNYKNRYLYEGKEKPEIDPTQEVEFISYYVKNGSKVYFRKLRSDEFISIEGVDAHTFKTFGQMTTIFSFDINQVYIGAQKIEGADPKTFKILSNYSAGYDEKTIYIAFEKQGSYFVQNLAANGIKLKAVDRIYFDGSHVFYVNYKIDKLISEVVNHPESLKFDSDGFSFDSKVIKWDELYN